MDPVTFAPAVLAVLLPYIVKAGEKAAETMGEMLPENAGKLWTTLTARFKDKDAAQDLLSTPDDQDAQAAFRQQIKKALADDPALLATLAGLLEKARQEATQNGTISGSHNTSIHVGGSVDGNIVVGNNNAINSPPRKR